MKHPLLKALRRHWEEVLRIKTEPETIALGFAIGTFLAILPLFGMSIVLGFGVVVLWKSISKIALFAALAIWNPLTLIPVYLASIKIGDAIFGAAPVLEFELTFMENAFHFSRRFLVGNLLMAVFLTIASYVIVLLCAKRVQNS